MVPFEPTGDIIGDKKIAYDLWGDTVNIASRMESQGQPNSIQVAEPTYEILKHQFLFEKKGVIDVRGCGQMTTYWLLDRREVSPPIP